MAVRIKISVLVFPFVCDVDKILNSYGVPIPIGIIPDIDPNAVSKNAQSGSVYAEL